MSEYSTFLSQAIERLENNSLSYRQKIYEKARQALISQLETIDPPLSTSEITIERMKLENDIREIEIEYTQRQSEKFIQAAPKETPPPTDETIPETEELSKTEKPLEADEKSTIQQDFDIDEIADFDTPLVSEEPLSLNEDQIITNQQEERDEHHESEITVANHADDTKSEAEITSTRKSPLRLAAIAAAIAVIVVGGASYAYYSLEHNFFLEGIAQLNNEKEISQQVNNDPLPTTDETKKQNKLTDRISSNNNELNEQVRSVSTVRIDRGTNTNNKDNAYIPPLIPLDNDLLAKSADETETISKTILGKDNTENIEVSSLKADEGLPVILFKQMSNNNAPGIVITGKVIWHDKPAASITDGSVSATILLPDTKQKISLLFRKNTDNILSASHLIEIDFMPNQPQNTYGIKEVIGILMKQNADTTGVALMGVSQVVGENVFWMSLNDDLASITQNKKLMKDNSWIDIPIRYKTGEGAVLTMKMGDKGKAALVKLFN